MRRNNRWLNALPYLILIAAVSMIMFMDPGSTVETLSYEAFQNVLEEKTIQSSTVTVGDNVVYVEGIYLDGTKEVMFTAELPRTETQIDNLM
ncbi:MAG: cell division protein FtsH, partial [Erysipelotrichaceae bacterium]|nr:cell division protein FtsH [Erysipelotrichaceae bacterium]